MRRGWALRCSICCGRLGWDASGGQEKQSGVSWSVPKRDLMAGLQVRLEQGELKIAKEIPEAGALVKELLSVRRTAKGEGKVRVGADGYGQHDDLVMAVALAVGGCRGSVRQGPQETRL